MENTVADTTPPKNLHPVWYRYTGFAAAAPKPTVQTITSQPAAAHDALLRAVQALAAAHRPTTR